MIILKKGRDKPIRQMHPWVFSGSIDAGRSKLEDVQPGDIVEVRDAGGGFLAQGYYNPHSAIRVRLLSWDQNVAVGPAWWRVKLARSIARRERLINREDTTAYRLVNAENDGLPGLVVDRYGEYLVVQFLTLGVEVMKDTIVNALADLLEPIGILERSDVHVRSLEGLNESTGLLWGEEPDEPLQVSEYGATYLVDMHEGHKTGFYLDQRHSRHWLLTAPAIEASDVLNCFSFTGSFGVCAALNGADSLVNVDSSQPALDTAREVMALNGLEDFPAEYINADVFDLLRVFREEERTFDLIILDPPKFAQTRSQVDKAARGYKDINLLAFELLRPGGLLLTFSCSGHVDADLFQKIVFGASVDADVQAQIVRWFAQPDDHPVALTFPEGRYLTGLLCEVMG